MSKTTAPEQAGEKLSGPDLVIEISQQKSPESAHKLMRSMNEGSASELYNSFTKGKIEQNSDGILPIEDEGVRGERQDYTIQTLETMGEIMALGSQLRGSEAKTAFKADLYATKVPELVHNKIFGELPKTMSGSRKETVISERFGFNKPAEPGGPLTERALTTEEVAALVPFARRQDAYGSMIDAINRRDIESFNKVNVQGLEDMSFECDQLARFTLEHIQELASAKDLSEADKAKVERLAELVDTLVLQGMVHEKIARDTKSALESQASKDDKHHLFVPRPQQAYFAKDNPTFQG